jgi:lysophospholipase L1-like esterase
LGGEQMEKKKVTLVGYGDSITMCLQLREEERWPYKVQQALSRIFPKHEITVINSGVGGNTSREGLARIDQDVVVHHPNYVLVEFGGNDATESPDRHVTPEEYTANLETIRSVLAEKTRAQVFLLTFPPVIDEIHGWGPSVFYKAAGGVDRYIEQYRQRTRKFAARHHLPLIDIDQRLRTTIDKTKEPVSPCIMTDGIHLTPEGSQLVADEVLRFLQKTIRDDLVIS